jgi:hypothetical protein
MDEKCKISRICSIFLVAILLLTSVFSILICLDNQALDSVVSAESTWSKTSDKEFKNGTCDNLIFNGTGEDAKLELDISGTNQWIDKTPTPRPAGYPNPKYDHKLATIATTDKVLMFGDKSTLNSRNETWVYDLSDNKWTLKNPINNPHLMNYPIIRPQ